MVTNQVSHPHNHCCNGNSTMCSPILFSYATANNMKRLSAAQQCFHAKFVDGNNKMYLDLHVKCLTFVPNSI